MYPHKRPVHVVFWRYGQCTCCSRNTTALDGDLLAALPSRVWKSYDSRPEYNIGYGKVRLALPTTRDADFDLVTHEAAQAFARKLRTNLARVYDSNMDDYNGHIKAHDDFSGSQPGLM